MWSVYRWFDPWKKATHTCKKCGWKGSGRKLKPGEPFSGGCEYNCPACHETIIVVGNPSPEEERAHWGELSAADRRSLERRERFLEEFERLKLKDGSQLPDIPAASFTLFWDFIEKDDKKWTVIRWEDQVLYTELAAYEGYPRFIEVAEILCIRYGPALKDLLPTEDSFDYLCCDVLSASDDVDQARKRIFKNT
jgi:hypothetical protein